MPWNWRQKSDDRLLKDMRCINADLLHPHASTLPGSLCPHLGQSISGGTCTDGYSAKGAQTDSLTFLWPLSLSFGEMVLLWSLSSFESWLLSKVTALIPTLVGPVAGFRLGFFPVRPIASTSPLEENNALAHFFLVLEYFSGCYKIPSDDQQHHYFYRPEIGMQNLHPHYQPTLFSLF